MAQNDPVDAFSLEEFIFQIWGKTFVSGIAKNGDNFFPLCTSILLLELLSITWRIMIRENCYLTSGVDLLRRESSQTSYSTTHLWKYFLASEGLFHQYSERQQHSITFTCMHLLHEFHGIRYSASRDFGLNYDLVFGEEGEQQLQQRPDFLIVQEVWFVWRSIIYQHYKVSVCHMWWFSSTCDEIKSDPGWQLRVEN